MILRFLTIALFLALFSGCAATSNVYDTTLGRSSNADSFKASEGGDRPSGKQPESIPEWRYAKKKEPSKIYNKNTYYSLGFGAYRSHYRHRHFRRSDRWFDDEFSPHRGFYHLGIGRRYYY